MLIGLEIAIFAFTLWQGLFLMGRNPADLRLRYAGLGLVSYAAVVACLVLATWWQQADLGANGLLFLPAVFWLGATLALLPETSALYPFIRYGLPWAAALVTLLGLVLNGTAAYPLLLGLVALLLLASVIAAVVGLRREADKTAAAMRQLRLLTLTVTLFFALGGGLLLLPIEISWLPRLWIILAISADLEILGLLILWLDAYEQGETLRPEMWRSLLATAAAVAVLAGQIGLLIWLNGVSLPTMTLLLSIIATAVLGVTLARPLATLFDKLTLSAAVAQSRAQLRDAEAALSRRDETLSLMHLDDAQFARLTRRALSHLQHLPRLASSPLTALPQVADALAQNDAADDTLGRANTLKKLLVSQIERLKPADGRAFAPTDEWRYYNALYFPYVRGLKPYSRQPWHDHLSQADRDALAWFIAQVPERTLYNWQNKGAELIALELRKGAAPE